jgi:hypothetical protein
MWFETVDIPVNTSVWQPLFSRLEMIFTSPSGMGSSLMAGSIELTLSNLQLNPAEALISDISI